MTFSPAKWQVDYANAEDGPWLSIANSQIRLYLVGDYNYILPFCLKHFRFNFTSPGQFVRVQEKTAAYDSAYLIIQIPYDQGI